MVPSIPEGGTKSRVETQVRVTVDLAHASASSGEPYKYDRVGSWKWLKLPTGTATKRRTRKEGKIDPVPQDMLYLTATVSCASPPHNAVLSCGSCQAREVCRSRLCPLTTADNSSRRNASRGSSLLGSGQRARTPTRPRTQTLPGKAKPKIPPASSNSTAPKYSTLPPAPSCSPCVSHVTAGTTARRLASMSTSE